MKPSRSRSGSSTSGGSDANGDQGRDKMPDSSRGVRPLNRQNKPDRMEGSALASDRRSCRLRLAEITAMIEAAGLQVGVRGRDFR
jgi:hypothetical protein